MPYSKEFVNKTIKELADVFVHLHVHSEYSNLRLLDSTNKIDNMIKYVSNLGQNGIALTDHESLSGHVKFIQSIKKLKKEGAIPNDFKGILGNEIYLVDEDGMNKQINDKEYVPFYHFLLLAKDAKGHHMLRQISSKAWNRMFSYKGMDRVPTFYSDLDEIVIEQGHLIGSTACLGSYFARKIVEILNEEDEKRKEDLKYEIDDFINWCIDIFGKEDFYIEIQPSQDGVQKSYNKYALVIAKAYGLKYIITTDAHYLNEKERNIHKAFLTSSEEEEGNREVDAFYNSTHFFTVDELFEALDYLDFNDIVEGINNTKEIADKVEDYDLFNKQTIPLVPVEETWIKDKELYSCFAKYEYITKMLNSEHNIYDRYLIYLATLGIEDRNIPREEYKETFERIDLECKEIIKISEFKKEPISGYFITMVKNIDIIWEEAEAIIPPGRGSAGGYILDYLLGITQVNPLKQGIEMPHFRFISAERPDLPDIDIDIPSHKRNKVFSEVLKYYKSIGGDIVRVCTFGTETAKSAIQTACRGCGINSDVGLYLSSLIPVERGKVWGISDCYYGNPQQNRERVTEFKNIVDEYKSKNLLEIALGVEGLINKRSSHACGVLIVNSDFTDHNAIMRSPSGEIVSQFNLEDSEYVGNVKYDFLNTKTASMIQVTLEMLVEHKKIDWQGTLRKTYNRYLHPDVIDISSIEMWDKLNQGDLISAFQFDSPVGEQAIKAIQPHSLIEATNGNNLMRLMVEDGKEQPLEMYVRYKNNIDEWYQDMKDFGLSEKEMDTIDKHLKQDCGVCSTQERMMLISMDENISNFGVVESNKLRKGVAKKKGDLYKEAHELFYKKGEEMGTSKKILDYLWDVQIAMQKGYGFSVIHGVLYTYILIQQLNLIHYYPSIYWNTAVLLVESGALEQEDTEDEEFDNNKKEKTTQYGKVATAISNIKDKGVKIALPNINTANIGFTPNEQLNEIQFGFKGIMGINVDAANLMIENRPFDNLLDFHKKMVETKRQVTLSTGKVQNKSLVSQSQAMTLIKAGAFDKLENKPREVVLENYVRLNYPPRTKLDTKSISKIINMGIIPQNLNTYLKYYNFRQYLLSLENFKDKESNIKWYSIKDDNDELTDYATNFFKEHFMEFMSEDKDYRYNEDGIIAVALNTKRKDSFEDIYNKLMQPFFEWLYSKECLELYNHLTFEGKKNELMSGTLSSWEMESMNYYYNEHELKNVDTDFYEIVNFNDLPEEAEVIGFNTRNGFKYPKFKLSRIVGTVLDRDKNKHIVTLLTPNGVVNLKLYSGQFAHYDKQVSICDEMTGEKTIIERSWFTRGTKLMVTGFRRGDQFKPKKYKNSIYQHTMQKILRVENGELILQSERKQGE